VIACPRCGHPNADDARYCSNCALELGPSAVPAVSRKTVTVMFMDVVGSTALGEQVDPESLRALMTRYFDAIRTIVERHGGTLEKYIGDAVMAVFGVPVLHEDDALRAVRAATEIREELGALRTQLAGEGRQPLAWRTGINTGEVVAGDAGAGQRFVSGDAVNVAARLEQAAEADETLLGEATFALVRHEVDAEPGPAFAAKGKAQALVVYRFSGLRAESAANGRRLDAPMVGRRRQRRLLQDAYEEVVEERVCHLFTILGSAGVGKSRLVNEFLAGLDEQPLVLRGRCLSYGEGITYWPVTEILRQAAGIGGDDAGEQVLDKLTRLLGKERDATVIVRRLGELLGVAPDSATSDETAWAVRRMVGALGRRRPLVVVLDDLHWAEPTLLDLVDGLADSISDSAVLLICLARRELLDVRAGWGGGKSHATTVTLEPLNEQESRDLVANLLGRAELGGAFAERVSATAEGNPLFVEEMLGMLIDSGHLVRRDATWNVTGDLAQLTVPPTIQALLAARIDRLESGDRLVLERASVEGHVFHRAAVTEMTPADLLAQVPDHLMSLSRRELIRPEHSDGGSLDDDEAYRFRHLLVRDAAYAGIPKATRAELHLRLAEWLRRKAADRPNEHEEILGYHYQQAYRYRGELGAMDQETRRLGRLGAEHLGAAGQRALDRGDVAAAAKLLGSATDLLPTGDPQRTRFRAERALALRLAADLPSAIEMLPATIDEAHAAGDEAGAAYAEVILTATLGARAQLSVADMIHRCESSLAVLRQHGDERGVDRAIVELAASHYFAGHARRAEVLLLDRMAARAELRHSADFLSWLAAAQLWGPTPIPVAIERLRGVLASPPNHMAECEALVFLGALIGHQGEFAEARRLAWDGINMMRELGRHTTAALLSANMIGHIEMLADDLDAAMRVIGEGLDQLLAAGEDGFASGVAIRQADGWLRLGNLDEAERSAQLAARMSSADDVDVQAEGLSVRGRVLAARGEKEEALVSARRAAEMAAVTDYLEMRGQTLRSLAKVELEVGSRDLAIEALRSARREFDAKGMTVLARDVERRLAELEAPTDASPGRP